MEDEEFNVQLAPNDITEFLEEGYHVVEFPAVQAYMEYDWFYDECFLLNSEEQLELYGSSAYLIHKDRI